MTADAGGAVIAVSSRRLITFTTRNEYMTLRSRLALGLVAIALILVGPLVFAIQSLRDLRHDARQLAENEFAASLLLGRLREGLSDVRRTELSLLFSKDSASRNAMDRQVGRVGTLADSLARFDLPAYAEHILSSVHQMENAAPAEYSAALAGDTIVADSLSARVFVPALNHADSTVKTAEVELQTRTTNRVTGQAAMIRATQSASVTALVLALIIATAIAFQLTRSISQPIHDLKSGMRAVADGDHDYELKIPLDRADEFGDLARSFQDMNRQLGELDKLNAEFVSVASHELKTPINVIIGYLQLLDEGVYGPLTSEQQQIHKTLVIQANTLLRLVKQLLDVSRFEAGGGRLELRDIRLDALFAELEQAFHVLAVQREVDFCVEKHDGLPDEVHWDLDRVNEVLGNLLSNAFKFTPHGGYVKLVVEPADGGVRMQVRDNGPGIPAEQLPRIFDKFYQADNQVSARTAGSGLGLAIAKEIVEAHGGSISCESSPGVGTAFTITLPVHAARRSPVQREHASLVV
jgi:signal transduction histidine kinase